MRLSQDCLGAKRVVIELFYCEIKLNDNFRILKSVFKLQFKTKKHDSKLLYKRLKT